MVASDLNPDLAGITPSALVALCLRWGSPEADPETRVRVHSVYVGGDPRRYPEEDREGMKPIQHVL